MIEFLDSAGTKIYIEAQEYQKNVLPLNIEESWHDPEKLQFLLRDAIENGFLDETIEQAALHLLEIDPDIERSVTTYGIFLQKNNRYTESIAHFSHYLKFKPDSTIFLSNLAVGLYHSGIIFEAISAIEKAITLELNNLSRLRMWHSFKTKILMQEGMAIEAAYLQALEECNAKFNSPGSMLLLGEHYAELNQKEKALYLFQKAIERDCTDEIFSAISNVLEVSKW